MTTMATSDRTSQLQRKRALERHFADDFGTLAYPLLANAYYQEGDMVRARKVCRIGLKHHPDHAPGLFLLALVNMREGRMEEAEQLLDRTLAQDPYHVEAAEYLVAIQERLKRPPGILERAYKILLLANPLSHSARARLKRMQAEKELVLKVKREMRLREAADRESAKTGGGEPAGELQPLLEVELPAKDDGAAEPEPAPFIPTARQPEEPPADILSDDEAERVERIEARLEESDQLTEAERSWERHIKDVATELAQTQQAPETVAGPQSTSFPLEDYDAGESEPAITTAAPETELPPEKATPESEGVAAVPAIDGEEALDAAPAEETVVAEEPVVEKAAETLDDPP
ncbi:MAG: tetratricopeptide repeat protein, partial [Candidatus Marinimicrobia bacterium]|nr:tetratricopeptide repeat protein [Candidatus Neomarinimicrobiota bacterium]